MPNLLRPLPASSSRLGADFVDVGRFREVMKRHPRVVERVFTESERAYCQRKADPTLHFAARFAVKEAVRKALGRACAWHAVEVCKLETGAPSLAVDPELKTADGQYPVTASVSITHDGGFAFAVVLFDLSEIGKTLGVASF